MKKLILGVIIGIIISHFFLNWKHYYIFFKKYKNQQEFCEKFGKKADFDWLTDYGPYLYVRCKN